MIECNLLTLISIVISTVLYILVGLRVAKWMIKENFAGPDIIIYSFGIPFWPAILMMTGLALVADEILFNKEN